MNWKFIFSAQKDVKTLGVFEPWPRAYLPRGSIPRHAAFLLCGTHVAHCTPRTAAGLHATQQKHTPHRTRRHPPTRPFDISIPMTPRACLAAALLLLNLVAAAESPVGAGSSSETITSTVLGSTDTSTVSNDSSTPSTERTAAVQVTPGAASNVDAAGKLGPTTSNNKATTPTPAGNTNTASNPRQTAGAKIATTPNAAGTLNPAGSNKPASSATAPNNSNAGTTLKPAIPRNQAHGPNAAAASQVKSINPSEAAITLQKQNLLLQSLHNFLKQIPSSNVSLDQIKVIQEALNLLSESTTDMIGKVTPLAQLQRQIDTH